MQVIVGIGPPGCGKTTLLKPLAEKFGYTYINGDDIRQEITGDPTDHTREPIVWRIARANIKQALDNNQGVILDGTYSKPKDRRKIIEYCRQHGASQITGYWFNLPLKTCFERNRQRGRIVSEDVISQMYNRLQLNPPALEEGFDEIIEVKE